MESLRAVVDDPTIRVQRKPEGTELVLFDDHGGTRLLVSDDVALRIAVGILDVYTFAEIADSISGP